MLNPYFLQKYAKMRHDEFLAEAQQERLLHQLKSDYPSLSQQIRWQLGNWFIVIGYKLKGSQPLILLEKGNDAV